MGGYNGHLGRFVRISQSKYGRVEMIDGVELPIVCQAFVAQYVSQPWWEDHVPMLARLENLTRILTCIEWVSAQ